MVIITSMKKLPQGTSYSSVQHCLTNWQKDSEVSEVYSGKDFVSPA